MTAPSPTLPETKPDAAQEILALIEAVDPSDTAKLDEIDGRVEAFIRQLPLQKTTHPMEPPYLVEGFSVRYTPERYTRSRDALKRSRPIGWAYDCDWWTRKDFSSRLKKLGTEHSVSSQVLPTEELAELHSLIQAIAHERAAA